MSGDVQPRKRKDKKRKKDELGVEEPRGTAALLGEGDVYMHSQHEHGTGGHWCAKVIFFSLLAVLITLIGLIILENRGLTDLEANAVESRYSGVLEGWLEDLPDDDHHDKHTLELNHHEADDNHDEGDDRDEVDSHNEEDDHDDAVSHEDEDEPGEDPNDEDQDIEDEDIEDQSNEYENSVEQDDDDNIESNENYQNDDKQSNYNSEEDNSVQDEEDKEEEHRLRKFFKREVRDDDEDISTNQESQEYEDENDQDDVSAEGIDESVEEKDHAKYSRENDIEDISNDNDNSDEDLQNDDDENNSDEIEPSHSDERENEDDEEHEEPEESIEVEKLEKEVSDDDVSTEMHFTTTGNVEADSREYDKDASVDDEDEEFLETVDEELPVVERIIAPAGKPFIEVEETSSEKPTDTLADEEEYEKQQEELRQEREQASHVWLKLAVGGALLVATHAVVRRATAPGDSTAIEGHAAREETPTLVDRRMTLIAPEASVPAKVVPQNVPKKEEELPKRAPLIIKTSPSLKQESDVEEEEETPIVIKDVRPVQFSEDVDKELYSDDDEEEEIIEEPKEIPKQTQTPIAKEITPEPEDNEEVSDDVEIIDDELDEEIVEEDEEVEEEISDVDDAELLSRLEAKYGRLPEPERPGPKHKDGGNSIDEWPGEPSDPYWREQLDRAEDEIRQGEWAAAGGRVEHVELAHSARARWLAARALDAMADARRDNVLLSKAITAYIHLLKLNERLSDTRLLNITTRTLNRIQFRGNYLRAEPVYRLLIRRFPNDPSYRNNLTVSFLMANRVDLAEEVLQETLQLWPDDRVALAHHGFVLKTKHNRLEEAVEALKKALEGDTGPACEPRFYYHLGDALLMLGRLDEANEVHQRGAKLGHFLSPVQRSLYNVDRLRARPWWRVEDTPYGKLARALEASWRDILKEGLAAGALFSSEREGLRSRGTWEQMELWVRGREVAGRCAQAPAACAAVRAEPAAACRRGQVKYSAMRPGTHVRAHVGPTNCRLRMHLGLANTNNTYIRVDKEIRQWEEGKVLLFDDSFEHEVWHNGTGTRLVLIVDVWHPDLTAHERASLPAI